MDRDKAYVLWFDELRREDVEIVGGKSSSLGEMTSETDVPVPYGFATTAYAYRQFMERTGLDKEIREELKKLTDVEDSALLREVTDNIRAMIVAEEMPADIVEAIKDAYAELGNKMHVDDPFVAVRSSATAEDLPDASFAGQQDTYLNVHGPDMVVQKIKECYASTFTDRATYYREKTGFDHLSIALSATVQMMVFSKAAGVMFSLDVTNGNDKVVTIEGSYGLGEMVVQGAVTPDNFVVDKATGEITRRIISDKHIKMIRKPEGDVEEVDVPADERKQQVITDEQIKELADYAKQLEKHYGCYMDMEWGIDERDGKVWLLQARPETVWSRKKADGEVADEADDAATENLDVIVTGLPASSRQGRRQGTRHHRSRPHRRVQGRRDSRYHDDRSRLGSRHAEGACHRHRCRWHDLSRRHRQPRDGHSLHRRHGEPLARGHGLDPGRPGDHGRCIQRHRVRGHRQEHGLRGACCRCRACGCCLRGACYGHQDLHEPR